MDVMRKKAIALSNIESFKMKNQQNTCVYATNHCLKLWTVWISYRSLWFCFGSGSLGIFFLNASRKYGKSRRSYFCIFYSIIDWWFIWFTKLFLARANHTLNHLQHKIYSVTIKWNSFHYKTNQKNVYCLVLIIRFFCFRLITRENHEKKLYFKSNSDSVIQTIFGYSNEHNEIDGKKEN